MTHRLLSSKYSWTKMQVKHSSWNQVNYSTDLCNEVESLMCISQIQKEHFSSKEETGQQNTLPPGVDFQPVCVSVRRPKLVRGFYLGKEPLCYHHASPKFQFFHPGSKNTRQEEDKMKPLKRGILYPGSLAVRMCQLQTRERNLRETETRVHSAGSRTVTRVSFAGSRSELKKGYADGLLPSEINSSLPASIPKQTATLIGQKTTTNRELKQTNLKLKRTSSSMWAQSGKRQIMRPIKNQTENKAFSSKSIHEERGRFNGVTTPDKGRLERLDKCKVPEFRAEYFTFKIGDYNIWSRVREP